MIKVGIVGGTGYTGVELLRLLAQHPSVEIATITSRGDAGSPVSAMFPNLRGCVDLAFEDPATANLKACDVVFFATPNGVAMQQAPALLDAGVPRDAIRHEITLDSSSSDGRADMVVALDRCITGIEIKSGKDTLDRLDSQRYFRAASSSSRIFMP